VRKLDRFMYRNRKWVKGSIIGPIWLASVYAVGWGLMLTIGAVHEWWPAVPSISYEKASMITMFFSVMMIIRKLFDGVFEGLVED